MYSCEREKLHRYTLQVHSLICMYHTVPIPTYAREKKCMNSHRPNSLNSVIKVVTPYLTPIPTHAMLSELSMNS